VAASKSKNPAAWGKWKKSGNTFLLTNNKGQTSDYQLGQGNWFPAYAYTGAIKLNPAYEKTSGGNYGNGVNSLTVDQLNFIDATHFTWGKNGGILTPAASAWKKSASAGTYCISGHTITFAFNNGKTVKTSFALGAAGSPAHPVSTLIFIGGYPYTDSD
jgi:hypothetical protein